MLLGEGEVEIDTPTMMREFGTTVPQNQAGLGKSCWARWLLHEEYSAKGFRISCTEERTLSAVHAAVRLHLKECTSSSVDTT